MHKKTFLFMAVIGALAIAMSAANCQAATIAGGNSMDNAVALQAGTYTGGAISDDTTQYFYVTLGQGQLITAKVLFTTNAQYGTLSTLALYNQDRNQVVEKFEANYSTSTLTASWLVNGDQPTYKYYLKLASDDDGIASYNMTLTVDNKYDAGSTKDAPTTFENALSVTPGTYKGYLGGEAAGNDTTDMYVLVPPATGAYTMTVTPPTDSQLGVTVYDANRQEVATQIGNNAGSIVTTTVQATQGANLFIKVGCDYYCSNTLSEYQMVIAAPATTNTNAAANTNTTTVTNNANTNTAVATNINSTANANTNTTATEEDDSDSTTLYLIIGGAIILVVIILVVIIVMKKKKTNTPTQQPPVAK